MTTARASFLSAPRCISTTIDTSQLNSAGLTQTFSLALKVPAGALVIARYLNIGAEFSGGGAAACVADFGDAHAGGAQGWYGLQNIFTGAGTGITVTPSTPGAYLAAGQAADVSALYRVITVTITCDVAVNTLTAGSLGVNVFYIEQAAGNLPK